MSHQEWFRFGNILSFSDIWFQYPETLKEAFLSNTWIKNGGFGMPAIQLYKILFIALWSFLGKIGLQFTEILQITHLIPIAILGFLSPYFLIKHLTKEKSIAFVSAVFYGSTTPFLLRQYAGHLSIAFIIALAPLILYLLILALEKNTLRQWIIFSLVYWIGVCYEPRIMYIVTIILGIYFLFFGMPSFKKCGWKLFASIALFVGLSAFWILPIASGSFSESISNIAERGLFGNIHYSIFTSLTLFHDSWTGSEPIPFSLQPIPLYFWIIPIIVVFFFLFQPKNEDKKRVTFFGIIWLMGIFLTKQASAPFPNAFQWLRETIPGFLMFRSGSKFWFVVSLGYIGLLSYGLLWLRKKKEHKWGKIGFALVTIAILIISFLNLGPLIMGNFGGMFAEREIPQDYLTLKPFILEQPEYFRTLWTPRDSRWGIYTNEHPKISNVNTISTEWVLFANQTKKPIQKRIVDIYNKNYSNNLLDVSSIKYIIIPLRDTANDDDFYIYYGNSTEFYINTLDNLNYLKRIDIGTQEVKIYENEEYLDHIYISSISQTLDRLDKSKISNVEYKFINPTEYKIIFNYTEPFYLYFSEAYHINWKLANEKFKWYNGFSEKNYVFDETHEKAYGFLNRWYVDPSKINKNSNGEYELIIYFQPQSYFYLGLLISGTTLFCCIGYLIYDWRRERKKKPLLKQQKA
ncbi:MAG: hypothetical protein PHN56_02720 [Candidatus Nanoarchaeia archaeon]|nr:hypothetical protein [Candidatus Nanoarchaeia archaeon]